jgi:polyadenylate-binding protein
MLTLYRIEDESALQAKVNEAMAVYDEYLKSQAPEGEGAAKKEESGEEKA